MFTKQFLFYFCQDFDEEEFIEAIQKSSSPSEENVVSPGKKKMKHGKVRNGQSLHVKGLGLYMVDSDGKDFWKR